MKETKRRLSVRIIALNELTNIFRLQNKIYFSLLIKINLITGGAVKHLQIMSLLGTGSLFHLSVMLFSSSPFSNMEVLLLKRNGSEIAQKVP